MFDTDTPKRIPAGLLFALSALIGAVCFLGVYGIKVLDHTNVGWLFDNDHDLRQHFIAWCRYRSDPWTFPFGLIESLSYPNSMSVIYTDSIPIFAVLFKIIGPLLPQTFQYFGLFGIISFMLTDSYCQATTTFTSQNYGAGNEERCRRIFWLALDTALALKAGAVALFYSARGPLVSIFTVDPAVLPYAMGRMRCVLLWSMTSVPYGVAGCATRGLGRSMIPAVITVVGTCLFRMVWLASFFQQWRSFEALMYVYPVSWAVTDVLMLGAYFYVRGRAFAKPELVKP